MLRRTQSGFVERYTTLFVVYLAPKKDASYDRLRSLNQRGCQSQSGDDTGFTSVTCGESRGCSVFGGSGCPSKEKKYSSVASLLGWKREDKESLKPVAKKSNKASGKSASNGAGSSSKRR